MNLITWKEIENFGEKDSSHNCLFTCEIFYGWNSIKCSLS
jgi:hypothetical protein